VSEQEQEQTQEQDGPEPDEQATPIRPPDEPAPDEEEEAHEAEEVEGAEGEPEPEQPQALSPKQLEQAFGKLERETERHSKRVHEIVGDDSEMLVACPLCDPLIPGFIMPTPATPERFPAVRQFMGDAQPADYQQDPNTRTCKTCAGEGVVETGSRVESQRLLACTDCGGKGWQGQRAPIPTSGPMAVQPLPDANGQSEVTPQGPEPPEAAKLRALGFTLIPPVGAGV
jgi:hypothetical protein